MASNLKKLHYQLVSEFKKSRRDDARVSEMISVLKLNLSAMGALDGHGEGQEIARDVLEISAFHALRSRSLTLFSRALSQLSPFYSPVSDLPPSPSQGALMSLSLLLFLAQNRISQFHTTLEALRPELLQNRYIKWVINLEQQLGAGAFAKAYQQAKSGIPTCSPSESGYASSGDFVWLSAQLIDGMRMEIASCASHAYSTKSLSLETASTLLFFDLSRDKGDAMEFTRRNDWDVDPGTGLIEFMVEPSSESSRALETDRVVVNFLQYAGELESIV